MNSIARDSRQIGNLIQRARKARKLSQKDLGSKVGLSQVTISLIENGHPARIETILALLGALGLELQITPRSQSDGNAES